MRTRTERILLVDDNPTNLQVLFQTLQGRDEEILVATDGEQALEVTARARPDLILLDIMMPGIDGFEVCRRLKQDPETRDIAVIFMSALGETQSKVRGLEAGAVDYITKPFQAEEVIARVATHLTIRRLQNDLEKRNAELARVNDRMRHDLLAAAKIQRALLPGTLPDRAGLTFDWRYKPCDELAGDSLGIFEIDDRHVGLYVLDVAGHGVPAALLSVAVTYRLLHRDLAPAISPRAHDTRAADSMMNPAEVIAQLNRMYPMEESGNRFFTMVYAVLDTVEHRLRYCSAGHPGPVVVHADGALEMHPSTGVPVGILDDTPFSVGDIPLDPGDRVVCYSDGAIEERSTADEMFGLDRFCALLTDGHHDPIGEWMSKSIDTITSWPGEGRTCSDDISLVGFDLAE